VRLETEQIVYRDGDATLTGFLVIDAERAGKRPGVLVVHGGAGVDDHARGRARRFARPKRALCAGIRAILVLRFSRCSRCAGRERGHKGRICNPGFLAVFFLFSR